jgi:MEMO1 family protein
MLFSEWEPQDFTQGLSEVCLMRKAAFAGSFYPKSSDALNKLLTECFTSARGPGDLPSQPKKDTSNNVGDVKAVIVPHAGYVFSGAAAAWAYFAIAESSLPDVFVVIGPSHHSWNSGISLDTFETPLGFVRVDQEFAKVLLSKGTIRVDEEIHAREHSVEVQLPMLQFSLGARAEKAKILPLLISDDLDLDKFAKDIVQTIKETKKSVTFIISSDFTHYGPDYGYLPFKSGAKEKLAKLDGEIFSFIKSQDVDGFQSYLRETGATVCGARPIMLLLKTIAFEKALLEQYYTSGDVLGDYTNSVSYASFVFK